MPAFSVPANLAFDSYGDLVIALNDWMDRSDLTGSAQAMIALAESRMRRELEPLFSETSVSLTTVDGIAALPTDHSTIVRVIYNGQTLPQYSAMGGTLVPTVYAQPYGYTLEANGLRLWPAGDFTVTVLYQPKLPALSEAAPTNELLSRHPDLYFFGAMMFANGYLANDERAANFAALWEGALDSAKSYFVRQKFAGPLVPRVAFLP
jgi:hypothetical protein